MKNKKVFTISAAITIATIGLATAASTQLTVANDAKNIPIANNEFVAPTTSNIQPVALANTSPLYSVKNPRSLKISKETEVKHCRTIHWLGNRVYTLQSHKNMSTHIIFPESAVDVVVGNKDLWTQEHQLNHVFIKPNTLLSEGSTSTLSYIGESGNSYEFILSRVEDSNDADECVVVTRDGEMLNTANWQKFQNKDKAIVDYLTIQNEKQKKQIISQQRNALDKYRGSIYTGYKWQSTNKWLGQNFVSDVYDDGRWTYIRITDDSKGVMAIYGTLDGKKDVLQFKYDETTKMYRISGIYPQLTLAYGKNCVVITRQTA
jgi:type IV secretory pathway VirB9-like protein